MRIALFAADGKGLTWTQADDCEKFGLTEANSIEAFSERGSPAHTELVDILQKLASQPLAPAGILGARH